MKSSPAETIANYAFPRWIFWQNEWSIKRALLKSMISRKAATVTWEWAFKDYTNLIEVSNSDYPELGPLYITRFSAQRLERLRRIAIRRSNEGDLKLVCLKALSGLGRMLASLPPYGISHSALYAGTHADERNSPLSDELKIALGSFPPHDTGLVATPNPEDKSILVSRGVVVCEVSHARLLKDRGHLVSLPDGSYRRAN